MTLEESQSMLRRCRQLLDDATRDAAKQRLRVRSRDVTIKRLKRRIGTLTGYLARARRTRDELRRSLDFVLGVIEGLRW